MKNLALWTTGLILFGAASAGFAPESIPYAAPYAKPVVERPSASDAGAFDGLVHLADALPPASSLKVLWTHGMCTHPPSWVDDRMNRLVAAIAGASQTVSTRPVGGHGAVLRTERLTHRGRTIDVMFLTWSPLTAPYKRALAYDHSQRYGGDFPYARATLNRELKRGLINDCMTDVVVYGGANGDHIRHAAQESVCEALGGRMDNMTCNVPPGGSPPALAFVTESLGSKLLFDAIMAVWTGTESSADKTAIGRVATGLAATKTMYMVANQLPLLDASGTAAAGPEWPAPATRPTMRSNTRDVFELISRARRAAPIEGKPMTVVAFSDPNDLLSYRIVPGHLSGNLKDFRIVNVIVSNDTTYFNYVERPDIAHCGYAWNPYVFGLLSQGYSAGRALPSVLGLSGGVCPDFTPIDSPSPADDQPS